MSKGIAEAVVGEQFEGFLLIKSADKGVASNGKPFLTIIFRDRSGEIDAKLWEISKEDEEVFLPESIVHVHGDIRQFRGKPQLNIRQIRLTSPTDGVSPEDFMEKAPVPVEELQEYITKKIFEMQNPNIQRLVRYFVRKYEHDLFVYPAATKNHHEYAAGLAHHVVSMLKLADQIKSLYPDINADLLYAGIILHDIGKVKELSSPMSPTYTLEGKLLGHITMMVDEVSSAAEELGIEGEEVLLLQHLILSHHGKAEWGSPKAPQIREAEVLHLIDLMDAKMNMMNRALAKVKPGEFTERIYPLNNRSLYKPTIE
ncbi:3'-5' exoribonuclease YhaM [Tenuibacillus multivorans]|uniref:3'-5' exoribonuclease n=1 Tax=Tenuibacillus multivorans TaxID=237069 RepID=A0A1H0GB22_9BACI|nr:3'-5' exoribonuclease YhaM [Tenuibacillus multivorans]GEL78803.1 3'-5' exoribonuclease YhaM [Tenuibacillus multivorans]SDO04018.1 3'-5' exoribonuclease [Tenuibacillus multivorans]